LAFLQIDALTKHFVNQADKTKWCVFRDLHFEMGKGEFVSVVGHSGCGKTTLLNIIAGLDEADSGGVLLDGREVAGPGLDRMVVFQSFALMPWMTVYQNVRLAVRAAHRDWPRARVDAHVSRFVEMVGLKGAEDKRPAHLSGGMRQRVGLARAFAIEPKMLLLDEPFAQIDALTRGVIQEELVRMWAQMHNTVFMVTHDVDEAILLSDKVLLMTNSPEARIAEIVDVTIPRPRSRTTVIEHPNYYRIRNHIIRFLVEGPGAARSAAAGEGAESHRPRLVRIGATEEEEAVGTHGR
jgi:nitrate/nitrite transport system ATP-binding protein